MSEKAATAFGARVTVLGGWLAAEALNGWPPPRTTLVGSEAPVELSSSMPGYPASVQVVLEMFFRLTDSSIVPAPPPTFVGEAESCWGWQVVVPVVVVVDADVVVVDTPVVVVDAPVVVVVVGDVVALDEHPASPMATATTAGTLNDQASRRRVGRGWRLTR